MMERKNSVRQNTGTVWNLQSSLFHKLRTYLLLSLTKRYLFLNVTAMVLITVGFIAQLIQKRREPGFILAGYLVVGAVMTTALVVTLIIDRVMMIIAVIIFAT